MIKHLESMQIGDMVVIRGRKNAIPYSTSYTKHIGMIASGTGITFMCQLIPVICDHETDSSR